MADFRSAIFARAFKTIPGMAYNQTLEELCERPEETGGKPLVYETVLSEEGSWDLFRDRTYPPFARYMKWKSISPENPQGVIVAVFFKESCYLLEGREFVNLLCVMEELTPAALHRKVQQWLTA
jgi:hypothetical protein